MRPSLRARAVGGLACALILSACGEATPTTQASESLARTPPATEPTTVLSGLDGVTPYAVAAPDDDLVAVGAGEDRAAAWASSDAAAWEPVQVEQARDVPQFRAVAFSADSGIAFGGGDDDESGVWTSQNGDDWRAVGSAGSGIDGRVNAAIFDGDTWIAAGDRVDPEAGEAYSGLVWTSDDGRSWHADAADLELNEGTVSDVAALGGTVVVAGFDVEGGKLWTSTDGGEFRPVDGDEFAAASIQGLAARDDGFVALGRTLGDLAPIAWTSDDGVAWTRAELDVEAFPPEDAIHDLASVDGRLVAVGASADGGVVWVSDDGLHWSRMP